MAFNTIDSRGQGFLKVEDLRTFIKAMNLYPSEKNLGLLFGRFDNDEDGVVSYDEFVTAITPFLGQQGPASQMSH